MSSFIKNKFSIFWIIIIFIISFNYISFNFFIKSFVSLETKENNKVINSLITSIDNKLNNILMITKDYSQWDNTYEFIENQNQDFIYENFRDTTETIKNVNLNFMFFVNSKNEIIHTQITEDINITNLNNFINHIINSLKKDNYSIITKYENNYYYVAKSKIRKSDLSGDFRGYIYTGKKFETEYLDGNYKNTISIIDSIPLKNDLTLKSKFLDNVDIQFEYGNSILSNIISFKKNDENLITFKLDNYREIYKEGEKQIVLFNTVVSVFIIIIFLIFYLYLYQHKKLNNQLEIRVKEEIRKQNIQETILIQQTRLAEMGEMINNIAHQWRQPLNSLGLVIQNINFAYQSDDLTQESLDRSINKSKKIITSMSNTIDTFRNFFEPNKNKSLFTIEQSIQHTLEILNSTLSFHNIEVIVNSSNDVKLYGFENEFSQVLLNIITNAKDALVSNTIKNPTIEIDVSKLENNAIITIKDNANGINEEIIEKIFDPYFTTKNKKQGTGIGLYMSKIIIEKNMNGQIEVKNHLNGVIFKITIPINLEIKKD